MRRLLAYFLLLLPPALLARPAGLRALLPPAGVLPLPLIFFVVATCVLPIKNSPQTARGYLTG